MNRKCDLVLEVLQHYRRLLQLHACVIMPGHFHLLLTPQGITLERCPQLVKDGFSSRYHLAGGLRDVWQKGCADHRVRDREDYLRHKLYIEQNPVKAALCSLAEGVPVVGPGPQVAGISLSRLKPLLLVRLNGRAEALPFRKPEPIHR